MRPALKICGVTRGVDVDACLGVGADWVGFNFWPGSKRYVTVAAAAALWREACGKAAPGGASTRAAAVVVDATADLVREILAVFPEVRAIQCHGRESRETLEAIARLPAMAGRELWRAVGVAAAVDVTAARPTATPPVNLVLFDVKAADGAPAGGTGRAFDWGILAGWPASVPFGLAGGIRPATVAAAVRAGASLIDLCSGVETAAGIKDPAAIRAAMKALTQAAEGMA